MDPATAALNAIAAWLTLQTKVWDATPKDVQAQVAGDLGKMLHNVAQPIIDLGNKVNAHLEGPKA